MVKQTETAIQALQFTVTLIPPCVLYLPSWRCNSCIAPLLIKHWKELRKLVLEFCFIPGLFPGKSWLLQITDPGHSVQQGNFPELKNNRRRRCKNLVPDTRKQKGKSYRLLILQLGISFIDFWVNQLLKRNMKDLLHFSWI